MGGGPGVNGKGVAEGRNEGGGGVGGLVLPAVVSEESSWTKVGLNVRDLQL